MTKHIAYNNGSIRDTEGKLIAFYDAADGILHINCVAQEFRVMDLEHAMDLVAKHVK